MSTIIKKPWTAKEDRVLLRRFPNERTAGIARALGRSYGAVAQRAAILGLKKSKEFFASPAAGRLNGRDIGSRFKKGMTPWNKGMKGLDIGGKATRFKKGQKPHTTLPLGSYRITKDGTLQRKISEASGSNSRRWRGVHELVWVAANGPVPPKHIVVFKPGMRTDVLEEITADKVECISHAENMRRNTYHRYPKEIAKLIQLRGALQRQINKRSQA